MNLKKAHSKCRSGGGSLVGRKCFPPSAGVGGRHISPPEETKDIRRYHISWSENVWFQNTSKKAKWWGTV